MIANASPLPFYSDLTGQHHRAKWYAYTWAQITCAQNFLPRFQIKRTQALAASLTFTLHTLEDGSSADITAAVQASGLLVDDTYDYEIISYAATLPIGASYGIGGYYLHITDGTNNWYSEMFAMRDDLEQMVQIEYYHLEDFEHDQDDDGIAQYLRYAAPYKGLMIFDSDVAKPRYLYVREVEERLGRRLDRVHIAIKEYAFEVYVTEEQLDALRVVPLHDKKNIYYQGRSYKVDELIIAPEWVPEGDLCRVLVTFRTNTVAIVAGRSAAATDYEPTGGTCITVDYSAVGQVTQGDTNYTNNQYTNALGETTDLEASDYIIVQTGSSIYYLYQWYPPSSYNLVTVASGEVVYNQASGLYFAGIGANILALPAIGQYVYLTQTIVAQGLPGATHYIYAVQGSTTTLLGTYTYAEIQAWPSGVALPTGATHLRMIIASGACGTFQQPADYELPGEGNIGIGYDVIGSTLEVY